MNSYNTDNALIKACVKGEHKAQRKLFEQFYSLGMSVCLRYARKNEDANEILSDSFIRVFKKNQAVQYGLSLFFLVQKNYYPCRK
ncbi:MAG: DNA-directed RNA polymerase specialized sigma24 family protein [Saprospiraceae bacterium]|jgi:DNA-directed RNA polymerase specialized sigma24 family protein